MNRSHRMSTIALLLAVFCLAAKAVSADEPPLISADKIESLQTQLDEATQAKSSARKKLALRRVIRTCDDVLEKNRAAANRYEMLGVLFSSQQKLIGLDNSALNRRSFLETCRQLITAPNEYAAIRLDADLLISQAELAQQGADPQTRAEALRPLVARYRDTEVEAKVIRIAMLMALEFGDAGLISYMRQVIAERFPGNLEMINFQRDKLAGQVFGAPFIGRFELSDGTPVCFPMDFLGKTTALYFWSKDNGGLEDIRELAEAWKKVKADSDATDRYQFVSFNLDDLPDAGESVLRELGVDWPAIRLPKGRENPIYKTYVRGDPFKLTMAPTGYTAMFMSGAGSSGRGTKSKSGYERSLQSSLARVWTKPQYTSQFQSLLAGDFLVTDPEGDFDPAAPPEWKAVVAGGSGQPQQLQRGASVVPDDKLQAIQDCFVKAPERYRLTSQQAQANYEKADALCQHVIDEYPDATDLWMVRNRRIVALMGLWKVEGSPARFADAFKEAQHALDQGYPDGTELIARLCVARHKLREPDQDFLSVISQFVSQQPTVATANAVASLLALEISERRLHEKYRRASLDQHAVTPMVWNATSFLLDRYHRYWMYQPPFVAGWTYGRRQGHFLAVGTPEDARRTVQLELKTLDGKILRIPEDNRGKWTIIEFRPDAETASHLARYGTFTNERPVNDARQFVAILNEDVDAAREAYAKRLEEQQKRKQAPDHFQTMLVAGGIKHPIVQQLGILADGVKPDILIIRPDGTIAAFLSGMTMISQHGNALQNLLEWQDEKAVDDALARGDLELAKRLAFTYAPVEQPVDSEQKKKPAKKVGLPHLRARTKVSMAMGDLEAAKADVQEVYLEVNRKAGWLSMRTQDLEETEKLKATIIGASEQPETQ